MFRARVLESLASSQYWVALIMDIKSGLEGVCRVDDAGARAGSRAESAAVWGVRRESRPAGPYYHARTGGCGGKGGDPPVGYKRSESQATHQVPHPHCQVFAAGDRMAAVRADRHGMGGTMVAGQDVRRHLSQNPTPARLGQSGGRG